MRVYRATALLFEETGFMIKKQRMNISTHTHKHDFIEIVFVVNGRGTHTVNGSDYKITNGSFFTVDSGETHRLIFQNDAEYYNLFLTSSYARALEVSQGKYACDVLKNAPVIYFDNDGAAAVEEILSAVNSEFAMKKACFGEAIGCYIKLLLIKADRARTKSAAVQDSRSAGTALPRILDYVNTNFTKNITIKDISKKYNYNPAYLGRLFRNTYKIPFNRYIHDKRIEYAKDLLVTTDYNIELVSEKVGYSNKNNFYKEFTRLCGCSPKEYRRSLIALDSALAQSPDGSFSQKV